MWGGGEVLTAATTQLRSTLANDKNFHSYYKEVGRTKMLTSQSERELYEQYKKNKDVGARDAF